MEVAAIIIVIIFVAALLRHQGARGGEKVVAPPSLGTFVVFDLETTGLDPRRHKIIEIAAIKCNIESTRQDFIAALIRIDGKVPKKITELTGITNEMLAAEGIELGAALEHFADFAGDHRLVSFNADFDMAFLRAACASVGRPAPRNRVSCALKMAQRAWPGRNSYRLADIARTVDAGPHHRALSDCKMAAVAYAAAAKELRSLA